MNNLELNIYLASQSPRRRELLEQLGVRYRSLRVSVDEMALIDETPKKYVTRISLEKATYAEEYRVVKGLPERPVLGADTCVALNGVIFGKPKDYRDAFCMLSQLSNKTHEVFTALALVWKGKNYNVLSCSKVTFCDMSEIEMERYWESGEPQDKAGSYAIQGRAAGFITHLEGSYSGVVGLPLYELRCLFEQAGLVPEK